MSLGLGLSLGKQSGQKSSASIGGMTGLSLWLDATTLTLNDGDSVGTWADTSGHGNDATQATTAKKPTFRKYIPSIVQAVRGRYALSFDGATDYVSIPHNVSQLLTGGFTLSATIKPVSYGGGGFGRIIDKSSGGAGAGGFAVFIQSSGVLTLVVDNGGDVSSSSEAIELNRWQNIAVTCEASGAIKIYINGVEVGSGNSGACSGITTTNEMRVGNWYTSLLRCFDGEIKNCRMWDTVLDSSEITSLQEGTIPQANLKGEWKLEDGTGVTAEDTSSTGNDGTITGATWEKQSILPCSLSFDGIDDNIIVSALGLTGDFTVFSVSKKPTDGASTRGIFSTAGGSAGNRMTQYTGGNLPKQFFDDSVNPTVNLVHSSLPNHTIMEVTRGSGTITAYINGGDEQVGANIVDDDLWSKDINIGSIFTTSLFFDSEISEIIVFRRKLSDTERSKVKEKISAYTGIILPTIGLLFQFTENSQYIPLIF